MYRPGVSIVIQGASLRTLLNAGAVRCQRERFVDLESCTSDGCRQWCIRARRQVRKVEGRLKGDVIKPATGVRDVEEGMMGQTGKDLQEQFVR